MTKSVVVPEPGTRIQIPVAVLEFDVGGNVMWIHNAQGATVLRVQCKQINVQLGCENVCAHADARSQDVIEVCLPDDYDNVNWDQLEG